MATQPRGAQKRTCSVLKPASSALVVAHVTKVPESTLEATPQSKKGNPQAPSRLPRVKAKATNPFVAEFTRAIDPDIREELDEYYDAYPELEEFEDAQRIIEHSDPYSRQTEVFVPQSRRSFRRFIHDEYMHDFEIKAIARKPGDKPDPNACDALGASTTNEVERFSYQEFIREYIRNESPYRGILVYHGLGSGKTCSAVAAAEALYGMANKKIIVMTPFSLRANFISEISFCGFKHFNLHNHWVPVPLDDIVNLYAQNILSLREEYLKKVMNREPERRVIWIPDFEQPQNYTLSQDEANNIGIEPLTPQERDDVRVQINEAIDARITFISYNGISAKKLKEYACKIGPNGKRFFDDSVIVIDEIHNVTRLMHGKITPFIKERAKRKRIIKPEPIVPGRWTPGLCGSDKNYNRAYLLYKLLTDARNSKIIGLSGTPIINFPDELGILSNILSGYIECVTCAVNTTDRQTLEEIYNICNAEPRIDIIRFHAESQTNKMLLSVFPEGYMKVYRGTEVIGVRQQDDAQEDIRSIFARLQKKFSGQAEEAVPEEAEENAEPTEAPVRRALPVVFREFVSYPRLPIDNEEFNNEFVTTKDGALVVNNEFVLKKRLTGLISYYKGSKEEYMPRVERDVTEECEMSDYMLSKYAPERINEIKGEKEKATKKEDAQGALFSAVEEFAKMANPSSYRFRSRAFCNFTFPPAFERPFPTFKKVREGNEIEELDDAIINDVDVEEEDITDEMKEMQKVIEAEDTNVVEAEETVFPFMDESPEALEAEALAVQASAKAAAKAPEALEVEVLEEKSEETAPPSEIGKTGGSDEPKNIPKEKPASIKPKFARSSLQRPAEPVAVPVVEPVAVKSATTKPKFARSSLQQPAEPVAEPALATVAPVAEPVVEPVVVKSATTKPKFARSSLPLPTDIVEPVLAPVPAPVAAPVAAPVSVPVVPLSASKQVKQIEITPTPIVPVCPPKVPGVKPRLIPYKDQIRELMEGLDEKREDFLLVDQGLEIYSSKLNKMLKNIEASRGSNLVYSQFKTVEGLGVLGLALKANGYEEIKIKGSDQNPEFTNETIASFTTKPTQKRFILFTGEGSKERRNLVLNIFNGNFNKLPENLSQYLQRFATHRNNSGQICWVIGITGAGAEGISLKCCRSVHIMEPYWNNVRLEQVKGRAIRICSHKELPYEKRTVRLYTYCTVFSREQLATPEKIDSTIRTADSTTEIIDRKAKVETSDENVFSVSKKKDQLNNAFLKIMKEAAVDCELNTADNKDVVCLDIVGSMNNYMFDPDLTIDKITTSVFFKETIEAEKQPKPKKKEKVATVNLPEIGYRGITYVLYPKKTPNEFTMYVKDDTPGFKNKLIAEEYLPKAERTIKAAGECATDPFYKNTENPFKGVRIMLLDAAAP